MSEMSGLGGEIGRVRFLATGHVGEVAELVEIVVECEVEVTRSGRRRTRVRRVGIVWYILGIRLGYEGSSFPIPIRR